MKTTCKYTVPVSPEVTKKKRMLESPNISVSHYTSFLFEYKREKKTHLSASVQSVGEWPLPDVAQRLIRLRRD